MWDRLRPGMEPMSPVLACRFLTTDHQGNPRKSINICIFIWYLATLLKSTQDSEVFRWLSWISLDIQSNYLKIMTGLIFLMFMPLFLPFCFFFWVRLSSEQCSLIVVTQIILASLFQDTMRMGPLHTAFEFPTILECLEQELHTLLIRKFNILKRLILVI